MSAFALFPTLLILFYFVLVIGIAGLVIYALVLAIRALRIYISKNS